MVVPPVDDSLAINLAVTCAAIAMVPIYLVFVQLLMMVKNELRQRAKTNVVSPEPYEAKTYRNSAVVISKTSISNDDKKQIKDENTKYKSEPTLQNSKRSLNEAKKQKQAPPENKFTKPNRKDKNSTHSVIPISQATNRPKAATTRINEVKSADIPIQSKSVGNYRGSVEDFPPNIPTNDASIPEPSPHREHHATFSSNLPLREKSRDLHGPSHSFASSRSIENLVASTHELSKQIFDITEIPVSDFKRQPAGIDTMHSDYSAKEKDSINVISKNIFNIEESTNILKIPDLNTPSNSDHSAERIVPANYNKSIPDIGDISPVPSSTHTAIRAQSPHDNFPSNKSQGDEKQKDVPQAAPYPYPVALVHALPPKSPKPVDKKQIVVPQAAPSPVSVVQALPPESPSSPDEIKQTEVLYTASSPAPLVQASPPESLPLPGDIKQIDVPQAAPSSVSVVQPLPPETSSPVDKKQIVVPQAAPSPVSVVQALPPESPSSPDEIKQMEALYTGSSPAPLVQASPPESSPSPGDIKQIDVPQAAPSSVSPVQALPPKSLSSATPKARKFSDAKLLNVNVVSGKQKLGTIGIGRSLSASLILPENRSLRNSSQNTENLPLITEKTDLILRDQPEQIESPLPNTISADQAPSENKVPDPPKVVAEDAADTSVASPPPSVKILPDTAQNLEPPSTNNTQDPIIATEDNVLEEVAQPIQTLTGEAKRNIDQPEKVVEEKKVLEPEHVPLKTIPDNAKTRIDEPKVKNEDPPKIPIPPPPPKTEASTPVKVLEENKIIQVHPAETPLVKVTESVETDPLVKSEVTAMSEKNSRNELNKNYVDEGTQPLETKVKQPVTSQASSATVEKVATANADTEPLQSLQAANTNTSKINLEAVQEENSFEDSPVGSLLMVANSMHLPSITETRNSISNTFHKINNLFVAEEEPAKSVATETPQRKDAEPVRADTKQSSKEIATETPQIEDAEPVREDTKQPSKEIATETPQIKEAEPVRADTKQPSKEIATETPEIKAVEPVREDIKQPSKEIATDTPEMKDTVPVRVDTKQSSKEIATETPQVKAVEPVREDTKQPSKEIATDIPEIKAVEQVREDIRQPSKEIATDTPEIKDTVPVRVDTKQSSKEIATETPELKAVEPVREDIRLPSKEIATDTPEIKDTVPVQVDTIQSSKEIATETPQIKAVEPVREDTKQPSKEIATDTPEIKAVEPARANTERRPKESIKVTPRRIVSEQVHREKSKSTVKANVGNADAPVWVKSKKCIPEIRALPKPSSKLDCVGNCSKRVIKLLDNGLTFEVDSPLTGTSKVDTTAKKSVLDKNDALVGRLASTATKKPSYKRIASKTVHQPAKEVAKPSMSYATMERNIGPKNQTAQLEADESLLLTSPGSMPELVKVSKVSPPKSADKEESDHSFSALLSPVPLPEARSGENTPEYLPVSTVASDVEITDLGARDSMLILLADPEEVEEYALPDRNHIINTDDTGTNPTQHGSLLVLDSKTKVGTVSAPELELYLREQAELNKKSLFLSINSPRQVPSIRLVPEKKVSTSQLKQCRPADNKNEQAVVSATDTEVPVVPARVPSSTNLPAPATQPQNVDDKNKNVETGNGNKARPCSMNDQDQGKMPANEVQMEWLRQQEDLFFDRTSGAMAYLALDNASLQLTLHKEVPGYSSDSSEFCDPCSSNGNAGQQTIPNKKLKRRRPFDDDSADCSPNDNQSIKKQKK